MARTFYVYLMTNKSGTLYTGITNDLERRVYEHKSKLVPGFTRKYNITRLVYFEEFPSPKAAIERETDQRVAAAQESRPDRVAESTMERLERWVV